MIPSQWNDVKNFKEYEFNHPEEIDYVALMKLDDIREIAGVPMIPTSDARPGDPRCHGTGKAFDIAIHSSHAYFRILYACFVLHGDNNYNIRIGVYDKHIHIDFCDSVDGAYPVNIVWHGISR